MKRAVIMVFVPFTKHIANTLLRLFFIVYVVIFYCFIFLFSVPTFDIPETVTCQDTKLSLSCEAGSLLHIKSANFGRRV